ncbi:suppressor protein DksA [Rickettsiella grylli]|uniref:RNA polymerase-binding transcription factor DksA n=2 Tax=Rickettsiella grylli TaxID=59196 RepID=A8PLZ9_9COXI|nr:suppressor protein DksA [Rickettsiella grylli]
MKRRKRKTTVAAKPRRRRTAKKTVARKPRRRKAATRKKPATRRKTTTRRKPKKKVVSRVKKKPGKSKISKTTSTSSSRVTRHRKPVAKKATTASKAKVVRPPSKKKQQQTKSDSQALPAVKQQLIETKKMAEHKKPKNESKKQRSLPETRLELTSTHSEIDLNIAPYKERPGEDYMSSSQQAYFRRLLLQRKRVLLEDMGRTVHHLQDEGTPLPDMSDRATQEEEFNLELRARDRERKLIKKIEDALHQLDEGHYGFCSSCGVEIGIRRLEARPTANLCIDCKTLDEIREKQTGG